MSSRFSVAACLSRGSAGIKNRLEKSRLLGFVIVDEDGKKLEDDCAV